MATTVDAKFLISEGYFPVRQLPTGVWAGLQRMNYTTGLFVGLDDTGYASRYCYESTALALIDLAKWDGAGDPPGKWIKHKGGRGGDRLNPRLVDEDF